MGHSIIECAVWILGGKRLELLKELLPQLDRVAVLWNATSPYADRRPRRGLRTQAAAQDADAGG
jgi:hypothetical protein